MEIKDILKSIEIIGVVGNYQNSLNNVLVKDLEIKNINKALKMVGLNDTLLNKKIDELSLSEQFKIDLATKLDKDIIIIGNLSKNLIYKDIEYIKKLLLKLCNGYNKKIVVIDDDVNVFINLVRHICVMKNKEIVYDTNDFYDDELYKYVRMPKIVDFIKYVNKDKERIGKHIEIHELIKDIFRRLS